jgi:ABC-type nitrate/sulfonate/bicarbonate transport system substrate-binding protein
MNTFWKKLGLSAVALLGLTITAQADDTVRYATDGYGLGAIMVVAAENGYFKEQGINPIIQTYAYGVDTVDAVLAGQADFGVIMDLPLVTRFAAGKLISPAILGEPVPGFHKLYALAKLKKPEDYKGKSFGVATGTAQEFVTRAYLTGIGLDPDRDVKLVGFVDLFSIVGAMKAGRLDAAWIWGEGVDPIKADSKFAFIADDSVVHQTTSALLATSKAYATAHADIVVKTLKALKEASDFIAIDSGKATDIVAKKLGADPVKVKSAIDDNRYGLSFATAAVSSLKAKYDFLVKAGKIAAYDFPSQFDAKALATAVPGAEIDASLK